MSSFVFVFSRDLAADDGRRVGQTVTVYAPDEQTAAKVLSRDLEAKRADTIADEPMLRDEPGWRVHSVELDEPKIVTFVAT